MCHNRALNVSCVLSSLLLKTANCSDLKGFASAVLSVHNQIFPYISSKFKNMKGGLAGRPLIAFRSDDNNAPKRKQTGIFFNL